MAQIIFITILVILTFDFLEGRLISFLNMRYSHQPLPPEVSDLYDAEKYARQQQYQRANIKYGWVSSTFSFLVMLGMLIFGGYAYIDHIARLVTDNECLIMLLFFGILMLFNAILDLPFDIYATFGIEAKFGFNRTTPKLFITDQLKHILLTSIIGGVILVVLYYIYQWLGEWFWLAAWATLTLFNLFMSTFYSNLIVPLFNHQTPLPEGELRTAIQQFAQKVDFQLSDIYVMDSSKRTTKPNAYFTGLGRKKRIVLYDTLISKLTTDEIVAVLAHEIGHYKNHHIIKSMIIGMLSNMLVFFLLGLILKYDAFAQAIDCQQASFHINIFVFGLLYSPVSALIGILTKYLSRRNEYQADNFALKNGKGEKLISSLKKISAHSLSNLNPHPLKVKLRYSHPTLYQRIVALRGN